jgi:hypothetical protein
MNTYLKHLLSALYLTLALCACGQSDANNTQQPALAGAEAVTAVSNAAIEQAFEARKSDVQLGGHGIVIKLLKDDDKGSRHQKFLVKINAQQTLLFAHNIDLAPRIPLQAGDEISFYGEYVYNPKGGVMHWTHHAPQGDHEAGWVVHNGKKYQ